MANTLKFGNGEWYGKKNTILAYNDENNNYKPLPFSFERASSATRVNKEGLIETVGSGQPRVDYKDDSKGALLLEPSRSNRVTYSEDLTQWTDYNASAVLSEETIYGKNAYKIVEDNTVNYHGIYLINLFSADGTNYVWSVYVKGAERRYVVLTGRSGISSNASALIFDTQDGVWRLDSSTQNQALFAEDVGDGWWRIGIEGNPTSGAYDSFTIAASTGYSSYLDANYQGDGTSGFYVAMPQLEQGSYATSYIPTSGSVGTRVADGQATTREMLIVENSFSGDFTFFIHKGQTSDDTPLTSDQPFVRFENGGAIELSLERYRANQLRSYHYLDATYITTSGGTYSDEFKCAIRRNGSDYEIYVNGVSVGTHTETNAIAPDEIALSVGVAPISVKDLRVFNTALSDSELIALTQV